jgi:hypothetical protein
MIYTARALFVITGVPCDSEVDIKTESFSYYVAGQRSPQLEPLLVPYKISAQGSGTSAAIFHAVK